MPILDTAKFTLTGTTEERSLGDQLRDRFLSVKDFGAVGDGSHDDTDNIQACFDYAFGAAGSEHSEENADLNWVVRFPRGLYKVSNILKLTDVHGGCITGAGSHQSRIFWSGPEVTGEAGWGWIGGVAPVGWANDLLLEDFPGTYETVGDPISSVLECISCWKINIEGLTIDASGVQKNAMWSKTNIFEVHMRDDGSDGYYRDVQFINGVEYGHRAGQTTMFNAMGSERTYIKCKFVNCAFGVYTEHTNALNHEFYGCYFANCRRGIGTAGTGGSVVVSGCHFENNSEVDVNLWQNTALIKNCHSTSLHFAAINGMVVGCTHFNGSEGAFWASTDPPQYHYTDLATAMLIGNHSSNGIVKLKGPAAPGVYGQCIHMMGNLFENADYLDDTIAFGSDAFVDDEQVSP